jgi:hypothetical protein
MLAAGALPALAFDGPGQGGGGAKKEPAKAAEPGGATPAPKDDKAAANTQRMLDSGIAAYEAGKSGQAIRAFDTVIRGGGLANQQMARALYYRGLAYRKEGRAALAISDLTSAIWLKDGLSAAEKQEAMSNRAAAYREAGVGDVPEMSAPASVAAPSQGSDGWQTAMDGSAAAPAASATMPAAAPQTATYAPARPPPPPPPASSSSSGGVGGFFSSITNMFGGGSSGGGNNSATVSTASVAAPPAAAPAAWSQTTQVATVSPPPPPPPPPAPAAAPSAPEPEPVPQAAAPPPASFATQTQVAAVAPLIAEPPQATEAPSGKFHVQVAAVRSRDEAYALAVRLVAQHGSELGPRRPLVDQTVIGSMGTFYRVRVGPFASAQDSQQLCGSIRSSGFDCLIITQ